MASLTAIKVAFIKNDLLKTDSTYLKEHCSVEYFTPANNPNVRVCAITFKDDKLSPVSITVTGNSGICDTKHFIEEREIKAAYENAFDHLLDTLVSIIDASKILEEY